MEKTKSYNRNTTKIDYLTREIQQLKDHIQTLEHQLKLNKAQLSIALQIPAPQNKQQSLNKNNQKINDPPYQGNGKNELKSSQESSQDANNVQALQHIIDTLQEENAMMNQRIYDLQQERDEAQGKNLVMEQMYESAEKQKKELIEDLKCNTERLQRKLKEADIKIHELEKSHVDLDELSGVVIQYRDVVQYNEQTKPLHLEIQKLNAFINNQQKELTFFREQREDMLKINVTLNQQVIKLTNQMNSLKKSYTQLRAELSSPLAIKRGFTLPLASLNSSERVTQQEELSKFPKYQDPDDEDFRAQSSTDKQFEQIIQDDQEMMEQLIQNQNNIQLENKQAVPQLGLRQPPAINLQAVKQQQEEEQEDKEADNNGLNKQQEENINNIQQEQYNNDYDDEESFDDEDPPYLEDKVQNKQQVPDFIKQQLAQQQQSESQIQLEKQKVPQLGIQKNIDLPNLNSQQKADLIKEGHSPLKKMKEQISTQDQSTQNQQNKQQIQEEDQQNLEAKQIQQMIKFHGQFRENNNDSDRHSDDGDDEQLPDKVNYLKTQNEEENQNKINGNDAKSPLNRPNFKLDLGRAKQIQQSTVEKQIQQENKKYIQQNGFNLQPYIDKINRQEQRLERAGKTIAKELLKNKNFQAENDGLSKINKELEARNDILIKSQKNYDEKWLKQQKMFMFYEEFFRKCKQLDPNYNQDNFMQMLGNDQSSQFLQFNITDKISTAAEGDNYTIQQSNDQYSQQYNPNSQINIEHNNYYQDQAMQQQQQDQDAYNDQYQQPYDENYNNNQNYYIQNEQQYENQEQYYEQKQPSQQYQQKQENCSNDVMPNKNVQMIGVPPLKLQQLPQK